MACKVCAFEVAYALATGQPEPDFKVSKATRRAALAMLERADLRVFLADDDPLMIVKTFHA